MHHMTEYFPAKTEDMHVIVWKPHVLQKNIWRIINTIAPIRNKNMIGDFIVPIWDKNMPRYLLSEYIFVPNGGYCV